MTPGTAPGEEPYHQSTDLAWTKAAFDMLQRHELHGEVISSNGIVRSRVWGPCPRCRHALDDRQTHTAVTNLMGGEWHGPGDAGPGQPGAADTGASFFQVDVSCDCGRGHPGAAAGQAGCGASFRVELSVQSAGHGGQQ